MAKRRRRYSPDFKAKVALEAMRDAESIAESAGRFEVHPTMISQWKRTLRDGAASVFDKSCRQPDKKNERLLDELYRETGKLKVERDFLSKKSGR